MSSVDHISPHIVPENDMECPSFPPVMYFELSPIYLDSRHSIPDLAAEEHNAKMLRGIDEFMTYIEREIDNPEIKPTDPIASCAFKEFRNWAAAGALTGRPKKYNRQGMFKRSEYLFGLNMLALKFQSAGFPVDDVVVNWLRILNRQNADFWAHSSNRDNLYVWSGATAALFAIYNHDSRIFNHQDRVWHHAISKIEEDGTIVAEMKRGQRALIYHMYSFSAILVLRSAREALGYRISSADNLHLKSLADMIGKTLCDPENMSKAVNAQIETPGDWSFRIPNIFGRDLLNQDWICFGKTNVNLWDVSFGGNIAVSADMLRRLTLLRAENPKAPVL